MKLKKRIKLINDYISLYKIILSLKYLILYSDDKSPEDTLKLTSTATNLKNKYEYTFAKFHMIDDSFHFLTQELNYASANIELFKNSASFIKNKKDISKILDILDTSLENTISFFNKKHKFS